MIKSIKKVTLPENCMYDKAIFFSDLHAGGNGDFNRKAFFEAYSWGLKKDFMPEECYFLGDIFDVTGSENLDLKTLKTIFPEVTKKVNLGIYLKGNHEGSKTGLKEKLNLFGLYTCHGYQAEWLFTSWRKPIGWLLCKITGWLERLGWKDIDKTPANMDKEAYLAYYQKNVIPWANKIFEKENTNLIISGHTHKPDIIRFGTCILANCGDFVGHNTFIIIHNNMIELLQVVK